MLNHTKILSLYEHKYELGNEIINSKNIPPIKELNKIPFNT